MRRVRVVEEIAPIQRRRRAAAGGRSSERAAKAAVAKTVAPLDDADQQLYDALREWRLREARRRRIPAFRILSDRNLAAICRARPADEEELLDVPGIGPAKMRKYGRKILAIVNTESGRNDQSV